MPSWRYGGWLAWPNPVHQYDGITLEELRRRRSEKWARYPPDVLPVWVAEMDFPLATPIRDVLVDMIERSDTGYADPSGLPEAYTRFAERRWGHRVTPDRMVAVPDVMRGIIAGLEVMTERGAAVVVHTPAYPPFFDAIAYSERRLVEAPFSLGRDGRYEIDLEVLEARFREGATTYLLNNPHNPTGRLFNGAELEAVAALCDRYGVLVLADEIHAPLIYGSRRFVPFAAIDGEAARRSVSFTSASKGWNLPGLKCALAVAHADDTWKLLDRIPDEIRLGRSIMGVAASIAAFDQGEPWLDDLLGYLDGSRRFLADRLASGLPQVGYTPPEATYLAWLDCRGLELGDDPARAFLDAGRVALYPGPLFGDVGRGFARFNFATARPIIAEAVDRMAGSTAAGAR
jgi:cysteine-S-conjugate beta-lyase